MTSRDLARLHLLASAVAGRPVEVAPGEAGASAWTDGVTVFLDPAESATWPWRSSRAGRFRRTAAGCRALPSARRELSVDSTTSPMDSIMSGDTNVWLRTRRCSSTLVHDDANTGEIVSRGRRAPRRARPF